MKRIVSIILLLSACVSAIWAAPLVCADADTGRRATLAVEGSLSAGLNGFSQRGAQVAATAGLTLGRYISVAGGLGVRHCYALTTVDRNIHGYGEPDQHTYGDRFLLPLFVRVQGSVPPGRFGWAGASFVPFARLDIGYAVDLQPRDGGTSSETLRRPASGPFLIPAAGLDFRLQDGSAWSFAMGMGIHAAQYTVVDRRTAGGIIQYATGNAVTLNFILGHSF